MYTKLIETVEYKGEQWDWVVTYEGDKTSVEYIHRGCDMAVDSETFCCLGCGRPSPSAMDVEKLWKL